MVAVNSKVLQSSMPITSPPKSIAPLALAVSLAFDSTRNSPSADFANVNMIGPENCPLPSGTFGVEAGSAASQQSNAPKYMPAWHADACPAAVSGQSNFALGSRSARGLPLPPALPVEVGAGG